MKFIKQIAIVLLFISNIVFSQTPLADSLKIVLNKPMTDTDKVYLLNELATELRYINYTEAEKYANQCIILGTKTNQLQEVGNAYKTMGVVYDELSKLAQSLKAYLKAISIFDSINDSLSIAKCNVNIGKLYINLRQPDKAIPYFKSSIPVFKNSHFAFGENIALQNMGVSYFFKSNYDSALVYFNKAFKHGELNNIIEPATIINIGTCHSYKKNYALAKIFFEKGFVLLDSLNNKNVKYYEYKYLYASSLQTGFKDYKAAELYYKDCKSNFELLGAKNNLYYSLTLSGLGEIEYYKKNYKDAYNYILQSKEILFTLNTEYDSKLLIETNELYEAEKKDFEIKNLNNEKQLYAAEKKQRLITIYSLITFAILLTLVLVLGFMRFKQKQRDAVIINNQKQILEQKNKEKDGLIQEIHHRVKNNLQFVGSLINMQINASNNNDEIYTLNDASRRIRAMALVHEMLYNQDEIKGVNIKQYIQELVNSINELVNSKNLEIKFNINCNELLLDTSKAIAIGMITSELISNSIKYAFLNTQNPQIDIVLSENNNVITFFVKDNGIGYSGTNTETNKLGMRLIDIFSRQLKGNFKFENNNGLKYNLEFKA